MQNLKQSVDVIINDKTYNISFPNVGQMMEIESKKIALGGGVYRDLITAGTKSAQYNLDLIDAISNFTVLIPELRKDLDVKSFLDIDLITGKHVVKAYNKQFYPWFQEIQKFLYDEEDELETEENVD